MTSAEAHSKSRSGEALVETSDENKHVGSERQVIVFFFLHAFKAITTLQREMSKLCCDRCWKLPTDWSLALCFPYGPLWSSCRGVYGLLLLLLSWLAVGSQHGYNDSHQTNRWIKNGISGLMCCCKTLLTCTKRLTLFWILEAEEWWVRSFSVPVQQ